MRLVKFLLFACGFVASLNAQEHFVYFQSNSFLLTETQKRTLASFFSSEEEVIKNLIVEGFCDDIGSDESNQILSQKRADEVFHFLQNELRIEVSNSIGKGEISLPENTPNADRIRKKIALLKLVFQKFKRIH